MLPWPVGDPTLVAGVALVVAALAWGGVLWVLRHAGSVAERRAEGVRLRLTEEATVRAQAVLGLEARLLHLEGEARRAQEHLAAALRGLGDHKAAHGPYAPEGHEHPHRHPELEQDLKLCYDLTVEAREKATAVLSGGS